MTWETGASSLGSAELTDRPQASLRNECSSSIHGQTQLVFILPRAWSSECLGESLWLLLRMWGTLHCQHVGLAEAHRAWEENSGTKEVQVPNTPGQAVFQMLMGLHSTPAVLLGPQTAASTTPDQCPLALSWLARMIQPFSSETNRYGSLNDCAQWSQSTGFCSMASQALCTVRQLQSPTNTGRGWCCQGAALSSGVSSAGDCLALSATAHVLR